MTPEREREIEEEILAALELLAGLLEKRRPAVPLDRDDYVGFHGRRISVVSEHDSSPALNPLMRVKELK